MGCVLGESQGREGAHRTSNTLKSDVSWAGAGEEFGRGAGARWGGQEEDDKQDLLHTKYFHVFVVWVEGWVFTEKHTSTLSHTARI